MRKKKFRPLKNPNIQAFLAVMLIMLVVVAYIRSNQQSAQVIAPPAIIPSPTAKGVEEWQLAIQEEMAQLPTHTPLPFMTATPYIPPTPTLQLPTAQIIGSGALQSTTFPTTTPFPTRATTPTPDFIEATPLPLPEGIQIVQANPEEEEQFQLPPEEVPIGAHPFDHFWFSRPVDVSANSEYLFYYPYGSSGQGWRIHHGVDMTNPIGAPVQAAADGEVVFAGRADLPDMEGAEIYGDLEVFAVYGNVVVIEHDFAWRGKALWTLYAHLSTIAVEAGQRVQAGDLIGRVGATGAASGSHVHFEVRLGKNSYYSTRNPLLWMAPYIGHGVVAGRITDMDGKPVERAIIQLNQGGRIVSRTTSYENPWTPEARRWNVVPDDNRGENFVLGDIPAGDYQLVVMVDDKRFTQNLTVNAGTITFVEFEMDFIASYTATPTIIPTALPTTTSQP